MYSAPTYDSSALPQTELATSQGGAKALAKSQGVVNIHVATFSFVFRQPVVNEELLEKIELLMDQLCDNNRIVCVQEADGVEQTLVRVATERGLTKCNSSKE